MPRELDLKATLQDPDLESHMVDLADHLDQLSLNFPNNLSGTKYLAADFVMGAPTFD
jgi:hypothetical protein